MKIVLAIVVAVLLTLSLARAADAPMVPADAKVRILKAQLEQSKLQSEANQLQARMAQIQVEWTKAQAELDSAREAAYKEAKVDRVQWTLDLGKLEFVPTPKPAEKKP